MKNEQSQPKLVKHKGADKKLMKKLVKAMKPALVSLADK